MNKEVIEAVEKTVKSEIEALRVEISEKSISQESFNTEIEKMTNQLTEAKSDNAELKASIENLKETMKLIQETSHNTISDVAKDNLRNVLKENYDTIVGFAKAFKQNKGAPSNFRLEFKAAAPHMNNNGTISAGTTQSQVTTNVINDENVILIRLPENFILGVIPNRQVEKVRESRTIKEQTSKEGDAALTAEGAVKPLIQYKFVKTSTHRNKHAGRIEWSEEFELDQESLLTAIVKMLERDVVTAWNNSIVAEMMTNATAYVGSELDGTLVNPDNGLAAIAVASQIQSLEGAPNVVFMNTGDVVATMYQQDVDGKYDQKPYIDSVTKTVGGMRLVTSYKIPKGTILVGESGTYIEEHTNYIMRNGQYKEQLITNEYTIIGEVFSLLSIAQLHLKYWVKADLDAVKTALKKA